MSPRLRHAAMAAGFVVAYAAACVFADSIVGPSQVALYWPASGLAFAVAVVGGPRWALDAVNNLLLIPAASWLGTKVSSALTPAPPPARPHGK